MKRTAIVALLAMAVMTMAPAVHAEEGGTQLEAAKRAAGTVNGLCPVMGNPVKRQGGSAEYRGEKIGFCCPGCVAEFQADPVRYMDTMRVGSAKYAYAGKGPSYATLTKAARAAGSANGLCPVMGNPVQRDGGAVMYKEQKIAFCCKGCIAKFQANPEHYMKAMRADPMAYAYERPGPTRAQLQTAREGVASVNGLCPVMGKLVTRKGGAVVYRGEKIAFCCPPCQAKFTANPEGYMAKVRDEAAVYGYVRAPQGSAHGGHRGH